MRGGFLLVDKPAGLTSHDVVARLRKALGVRRVGHAGTLDKPARGLLIVGVGPATRLLRFLAVEDKSYRGTVVFGVSTDTDDATGRVLSTASCDFDRDELAGALERLRGMTAQYPPVISAVQVGGERLYRRARRGDPVAAPLRRVVITRVDLIDFLSGEHPRADLEIECSKGTYIRAMARDLGEDLGCGAHLSDLVRLSIGRFTLENALPLDGLVEMAALGTLRSAMLPPEAAVEGWPAVRLDGARADACLRGAPLGELLPSDVALPEGRAFALLGAEGELVAVAEIPAREHGNAGAQAGGPGPRYLMVYSANADP